MNKQATKVISYAVSISMLFSMASNNLKNNLYLMPEEIKIEQPKEELEPNLKLKNKNSVK